MDYDLLIARAALSLPAQRAFELPLRLDMCRHVSVKDPTFWVFAGATQIGCAAYEPGNANPWRGARIFRGSPVMQARFSAMETAIQFAAT